MRTIRVRLTLGYAALLVATLVLLGTGIYIAMAHALYREIWYEAQALAVQAERLIVAGSGESEKPGMDLSDPDLVHMLARGNAFMEMHDSHGRLISRSTSLQGASLVSAKVSAGLKSPAIFIQQVPTVGPVAVYAVPVWFHGKLLGTVDAGRSLTDIKRTTRALADILLLGGLASLAVGLLGGWWMAGAALRPVDRITRAAHDISAGALSRRLRLQGPNDEFHRLAAAFDDMLDRLESAFRRERQLTADVAHELKTPLTVLQGEIDVALRRRRSSDEYERCLHGLHDEVARLSRLVNSMLLLARADAGSEPFRTEPVRLGPLLTDAGSRYAVRARASNVTLNLNGQGDPLVEADAERLLQAVTNVLDNAFAYTQSGGTVELGWSDDDRAAIIHVQDNGCGIAAEHLHNVFRRFYRADSHRARTEGGSGLGLAIAKWIVEAHQGRIAIKSQKGSGTKVTMTLPRCVRGGGR